MSENQDKLQEELAKTENPAGHINQALVALF